MTDTKKRAEIVSSFTDAGTGERFEAGATPMIDAGAFGNYQAAGLVRTPVAKAAPKPRRKPADKAPGKATSRVKAAPAAPASTVPAAPPAPATGEGGASA